MRINHFFYKFRFKIGRVFTDQRVVLELQDASRLDRRSFPEEKALTVSAIGDIPAGALRQLEDVLGHGYLASADSLLQQGGAQLTVLLVDGALASVSWLRKSTVIPKWTIAMSEDDYVFNRGYTVPAFRGNGCYARCITAGYDSVLSSRGRFLTDCHVYNEPSIRQFKRSGFEIIARGRIEK